jgi:DNA-binding FadR family transcriptional regulator
VHQRGMAREIQERIKKLIVDQRLPSGAPMPTENELMDQLGVSRNSVREALKALQAMGIIEIRHGFGTYVGPMSMAPMIEGLTFRTVAGHYRGEDSLLQLLELREAIEAGLIARLVESVGGAGGAGEADLRELETLVARMRREAESGNVRAQTDRAFHVALYRGLNNSLLSEVLDAFWDAFHRVRTDLADLYQDPRNTWSQHAEILAALRAGDTLRAETAVRDHFGHLRARLRSTMPGQAARTGPETGSATGSATGPGAGAAADAGAEAESEAESERL